MRLERAVRFGFVGTVGVTAIASGTFWMFRISEDPAMPAGELFVFLLVVGTGTWVALMFLFVLFDVFVDEKLDARGRSNPEE